VPRHQPFERRLVAAARGAQQLLLGLLVGLDHAPILPVGSGAGQPGGELTDQASISPEIRARVAGDAKLAETPAWASSARMASGQPKTARTRTVLVGQRGADDRGDVGVERDHQTGVAQPWQRVRVERRHQAERDIGGRHTSSGNHRSRSSATTSRSSNTRIPCPIRSARPSRSASRTLDAPAVSPAWCTRCTPASAAAATTSANGASGADSSPAMPIPTTPRDAWSIAIRSVRQARSTERRREWSSSTRHSIPVAAMPRSSPSSTRQQRHLRIAQPLAVRGGGEAHLDVPDALGRLVHAELGGNAGEVLRLAQAAAQHGVVVGETAEPAECGLPPR
jgi:hypothetical protein